MKLNSEFTIHYKCFMFQVLAKTNSSGLMRCHITLNNKHAPVAIVNYTKQNGKLRNIRTVPLFFSKIKKCNRVELDTQ